MKAVKVGEDEIPLNPKLLQFTEATLNQFLQSYAAYYNFYVEKHSMAQHTFSKLEDRYDRLFAMKFQQYKELGGSDKLCESKAKIDEEVQQALEQVRDAKLTSNLLWGFLRSMDRAHENAMQLCYNVRKEMDKLFSTVKKGED